MKRKLYTALLRVRREEVDAPIIPTINYYYNKTIGDIYHFQNREMIH